MSRRKEKQVMTVMTGLCAGDGENESAVLAACSNDSAVLKSNGSLYVTSCRRRCLSIVNTTPYSCRCSATLSSSSGTDLTFSTLQPSVATVAPVDSTGTLTVSGVLAISGEENCSHSVQVRSSDASKTVCSSPVSVANESTSTIHLDTAVNNFTVEYIQSSSAAQRGVFVLQLHGTDSPH